MVKYLENPICELTPLFNIDYKKKKNIISASFFKMAGGSYKDFTKYSNGVLYLAKYVRTQMKDFTLRLFIEKSIYNDKTIMKELNKDKSIELVLYNCPDYIKNKDKHKGIFGMFVRFFPIFDFNNNDSETVLITDIDYDSYKQVNSILSKRLKKDIIYKKTDDIIFIQGDLFYHTVHNNIFYDGSYVFPFIIGDRIVTYNKIDKEVILNYLKEINISKYVSINNKYYKDLNNMRKKLKTFHLYNNYNKNKINTTIHLTKAHDNNFRYGVDEYFLNTNYMDYIKKNKLPFSIILKYTLANNIFSYITYWNIKMKKDSTKIYRLLFTYLFGDNKNKSIKVLSEILYKKLNIKEKKLTEESIKLFTKLYLFYIKIYKTKYARHFNKPFLRYILEPENIGIVMIDKHKYYNSTKKDRIMYSIKLPDENTKILRKYINSH
jgi:hypothetical protein